MYPTSSRGEEKVPPIPLFWFPSVSEMDVAPTNVSSGVGDIVRSHTQETVNCLSHCRVRAGSENSGGSLISYGGLPHQGRGGGSYQ